MQTSTVESLPAQAVSQDTSAVRTGNAHKKYKLVVIHILITLFVSAESAKTFPW